MSERGKNKAHKWWESGICAVKSKWNGRVAEKISGMTMHPTSMCENKKKCSLYPDCKSLATASTRSGRRERTMEHFRVHFSRGPRHIPWVQAIKILFDWLNVYLVYHSKLLRLLVIKPSKGTITEQNCTINTRTHHSQHTNWATAQAMARLSFGSWQRDQALRDGR